MRNVIEIEKMINKLIENNYPVELKYLPNNYIFLSIFAPSERGIIRTEIYNKHLHKDDLYKILHSVYINIIHPTWTEEVELNLDEETIKKAYEQSDELGIPFDEYVNKILESFIEERKCQTECRMRRRMW